MSFAEEKHTGEKNALLIEAYQNGDNAALETLVCENIGLVKNIARRFYGRGTEYEDIVQIGTIGMIKAAKSFDSAKGTVFSTYAVPLIIGEIRRFLRDDGIIKVSIVVIGIRIVEILIQGRYFLPLLNLIESKITPKRVSLTASHTFTISITVADLIGSMPKNKRYVVRHTLKSV